MGNSLGTSGITINLHQNNPIYFTDEPLSGTVCWNNRHETVRTSTVYIILIGEVGYTAQRMAFNPSDGTRKAVTEFHYTKFYSSKISLVDSPFENELIVLSRGQYSWPFEFILSNYLPPTINSRKYDPHVRYYLQVVIEKSSWYKSNIEELQYLTIYPRINLPPNSPWLQRSFFEDQNKNEISLKGFISKTCFIPGESIEFTIDIDNPREFRIKHIDLSIFQSLEIARNSKQMNIFQTILPSIQDTNGRQIKETISVTAPAVSLPPSCQFQGGSEEPVSILNRYFIKLAADVEGISMNFDIEIPIIIATEPGSCACQSSALIPQYDEPPPSYDSVVKHIK